MKKKYKNLITLLGSMLFYVINSNIEINSRVDLINIFFKNYFNDMLASIVLLSYSNFLLLLINKELRKLRYIYLIILICGVIWEIITPIFRRNSICDLYDFLAYFVGATIYCFINQGIAKRTKTPNAPQNE
ncbi:MAG: hypothetical protein PHE79_01880 [Eubacteriales bacterium]|nr:hypothetical protein [Eubacteriales bacterium]